MLLLLSSSFFFGILSEIKIATSAHTISKHKAAMPKKNGKIKRTTYAKWTHKLENENEMKLKEKQSRNEWQMLEKCSNWRTETMIDISRSLNYRSNTLWANRSVHFGSDRIGLWILTLVLRQWCTCVWKHLHQIHTKMFITITHFVFKA